MYLLDKVKRALGKIKFNLAHHYFHGMPPKWLMNWYDNPNDHIISKWWKPGIPRIEDNQMNLKNIHKNTTLKWYCIDSEEKFNDVVLTPHDYWKFTKDNVNYTFNSLGYRSDEPDADCDYTILVSGDSHTFGVGLDDKQVWPYQLKLLIEKEYKKCKIINVSEPGGSNDWISRSLTCAIENIKPDCVIAVYTYPNRREAIWDSGLLYPLNTTIPDISNQKYYLEFQSWFMTVNEHTNYYNLTKNHILIKNTCKAYGIKLLTFHDQHLDIIQRELTSTLGYQDVARDLKHFGPAVHKYFAEKIYNETKK